MFLYGPGTERPPQYDGDTVCRLRRRLLKGKPLDAARLFGWADKNRAPENRGPVDERNIVE